MRVELRLERDEHEYRVEVETDQSVDWDVATQACVNALDQLVGGYTVRPGEPGFVS